MNASILSANILLTTILSGNFVLAMFLGMCPFLGVSHSVARPSRWAWPPTFVIVVASCRAYC